MIRMGQGVEQFQLRQPLPVTHSTGGVMYRNEIFGSRFGFPNAEASPTGSLIPMRKSLEIQHVREFFGRRNLPVIESRPIQKTL